MSDENVANIVATNTYATWSKQRGWKPLNISKAQGNYFWDSEGKKYLDFSGQAMCMHLGHQHPEIIASIESQARELCYIKPRYATEVRANLCERLLEVMPSGLVKFLFTSSGTAANEAALKIARQFTGKRKIISRYNSYHGSTAASISVSGDFRRWYHEPTGVVPNTIFAPDTNCFKCALNHVPETCNTACVSYIEYILENENDVAAVIVEPIVGTNGVLIPPDDYLLRLRKICTSKNIVLIFDEVMSGWYRTGKWFACDHWRTVPDILTTAKGITSGATPLAVTATNGAIARFFDDELLAVGHTYASHPLSMSPAIKTIEIMSRPGFSEHITKMSNYLRERLLLLKGKHTSVVDVRGKGLFFAVEICSNIAEKSPFNTMRDKFECKPTMTMKIAERLMSKGVYIFPATSHFVLAPPLIVGSKEIDLAIEVFDWALEEADKYCIV